MVGFEGTVLNRAPLANINVPIKEPRAPQLSTFYMSTEPSAPTPTTPAMKQEEDIFAINTSRCEERNAAAGMPTSRGERHMMAQWQLSVKIYAASEWPGGLAAGFTKELAHVRYDRAMERGVAIDRQDGVEPHWVQHWRGGRTVQPRRNPQTTP